MPNQADTTPIALSPTTYERHAAAVEFVESQIQTRDPRWGTGRFPGLIPGRWGLLAMGDTIGGGGGMSIGTGTVKLCDREGTPIDEADVTVANTGATITAEGGPRIVRLGWTAGEWCVTCAPGAPDPYE